jgi:hypothetical protein
MSPPGTPGLGRPTMGEEDTESESEPEPAPALRQTRFSDPSEIDTDRNEPWSDAIEEKDADTTRIFFQNTNGISAANDFCCRVGTGLSR